MIVDISIQLHNKALVGIVLHQFLHGFLLRLVGIGHLQAVALFDQVDGLCGKDAWTEGLFQIGIRSCLKPFLHISLTRQGREQDDGQAVQGLVGTNAARQFEAIHDGHHHVAYQQVEGATVLIVGRSLQQFQRLHAIAHAVYLEIGPQFILYHLGQFHIILCHEHAPTVQRTGLHLTVTAGESLGLLRFLLLQTRVGLHEVGLFIDALVGG